MKSGHTRSTRSILFVLVCSCAWFGAWTTPAKAQSREPVRAEHAMVVSGSRLASEAGVEIMRQGGNAFDAAAATGFVLAVTLPHSGNIGGGGFMVAVRPSGKAMSLDFRETAPAAAHRDMFLDAGGEVVPDASLHSPLASGVPGSVDGLLRMWKDKGSGKIDRRALLSPAIRLAESGFLLSEDLAEALNKARPVLSRDPAASRIFVRADGGPWRRGDRFVQRDLAGTLRAIAESGRKAFYRGAIAERIAEQMSSTGGLITKKDLANYASIYRRPVRGTFREYEIISMGPPSSGGIFLIQMLNMIEDLDLEAMGRGTPMYVHLLTEVQRLAYADRAEHLGDPAFWDVPMKGLLEKRYAQKRASSISLKRARPSAEVGHGRPSGYRKSHDTTHYSVVDRDGNAVAVTFTINTAFGSGIVVDGAGFLLNNEMDDFSLKPGSPNFYGLVGNEANAIQARKRMLSSMSPTVVLKDGKARYVLGTPGGGSIITTILQIFLNAAVHDMNIQEAVSVPRHHSQWLPDVIFEEPDTFTPEMREALEELGHTIVLYPRTHIGKANCIEITGDGLLGAPDPRSDNYASGY